MSWTRQGKVVILQTAAELGSTREVSDGIWTGMLTRPAVSRPKPTQQPKVWIKDKDEMLQICYTPINPQSRSISVSKPESAFNGMTLTSHSVTFSFTATKYSICHAPISIMQGRLWYYNPYQGCGVQGQERTSLDMAPVTRTSTDSAVVVYGVNSRSWEKSINDD